MTKREWYVAIREIVAVSDYEDVDGAIEFLDRQIELIDARAAKSAERAAAKKAEGDALRQAVLDVITNEPQTVNQIVEAVGNPEVTKSKIVARLGQLVKAGSVTKTLVTIEGRRLMTYALAE